MYDPMRPGQMVKTIIEELGMSSTHAAAALGVTQEELTGLLDDEGVSISPDMAERLEAVFGSSVDQWLRMQAAYDEARVG